MAAHEKGWHTVTDFRLDKHGDEVLAALHAQLTRAMERVGLEMERNAKLLCPVDTGNLRNSITHQSTNTEAIVGTNVDYAPSVELGTSHQKAQPYLKPAVADNKSTYVAMIRDELKKG
jgi:HK97 gp10 family phage protein